MRKKLILFCVIVYNALEYYQSILYGFFSFILSSTFFPSQDISFSILASLSTFAVGFLTNPFGGLVFGYFGDKYGRKSTITLSIILTSLPTFCIGILPTYAEVGIISSISLIVCRLVQGFSVGGQAYSRVVFVVEHSFREKANFACGLLASSSLIGAVLGTGIGILCMLDIMPQWAWRVPFLLGGLFGFISYFIMKNVDETQEHEEAQRSNSLKKSPIVDVIKSYLNNFLCTIGISGATLIPFYIISIYMIEYIFSSNFGFSSSQIMATLTFFMVLWAVLLPILGYIADKLGEVLMMKVAAISMLLFSFPLCFIMQISSDLPLTFLAIGLLSLISSAYVAPSGTFMTKLFPVSLRCSGISVASGLGSAIFGGTAPLFGVLLVESSGIFSFSAFYLVFGGLMGLIALKKAKINSQKEHKVLKTAMDISQSRELIPTLNKQGYMLRELNEYSRAFVDFAPIAPGPVLDIGAAYGVATLPALEKGAHVIANDLDIRHLKILEENVSESYRKNLELKLGKIPGEVDFPENSLGAVLASGVLHFLPGDELIIAVKQIHKWLKPGGKFFFVATTPYAKLYQEFLPLYLKRKEAGYRWPGLIKDTSYYVPNIAHQIPKSINLIDIDILDSIIAETQFFVEKKGFFTIDKIANDINSEGNNVLGLIAYK